MDGHRFDADPDHNFHIDVDPDPDPDRHQNHADPHAEPTPSFHMLENHDASKFLVTALPVYTVLSFSSVSTNVSEFSVFWTEY